MGFGDISIFLGALLTFGTAVVACSSWLNSRLNSLSKEMQARFDSLENKYVSKELYNYREKEFNRRMVRVEGALHVRVNSHEEEGDMQD